MLRSEKIPSPTGDVGTPKLFMGIASGLDESDLMTSSPGHQTGLKVVWLMVNTVHTSVPGVSAPPNAERERNDVEG